MIIYKTDEEIEQIKKSCEIAAAVLLHIADFIKPGVSTEELDRICHDYILSRGATPSPLNYKGYQVRGCRCSNRSGI
jgi:methionyl aminopeptidase